MLNKISILILIISMCILSGCMVPEPEGMIGEGPLKATQINSDELKFTAAFPGEPDTLVETVDFNIVQHYYNYDLESEFSVFVYDFSQTELVQEQREIFFGAFTNTSEYEVVEEKDISTEDTLGKEVKYKFEYVGNTRVAYTKFFLKGDKMYQVISTYKESNGENEYIASFVNSFSIN